MAAVDWLTYRHWKRQPAPQGGVSEAAIEDDCGYNQTRPVEEPAEIVDLMLSCRIRAFGRGELLLFATDGREQFVVENRSARTPGSRSNTMAASWRRNRATKSPPVPLFARTTLVELSLFDRQVLLALDGELAFEPYQICTQ